MSSARNLQRLRPLLDRLTDAVAAENGLEFERVLDDLVHARRKELFAELRRLTAKVQTALEKLQLDARFNSLATRDMPEARQRLEYVMTQTDQAAHQTLTLIELSFPLVDVLTDGQADADPGSARTQAARQLRQNLSEMLMAQTYQDLTGQVLRGLIVLVGEVEAVLGELIQVGGAAAPQPAAANGANGRGFGPVIPGIDQGSAVVSSQQDVDSLLSDLGL